ncbi:MAG: transporter [Gracilibacter sp. BRH_c7a]|nr:MAG: transporter [Gracilibacter sp. BRH_c7a]
MESKKRPARKRRNQVPIALGLLLLIIIAGIMLAGVNSMLAIYWIFGISFGIVLQKSRFCFTASLRDPVLTGSTTLTRAVLIAFMVATVGFGAIQFKALLSGVAGVPGNIFPVGLHTAIGAIMFGIGMVIAGGCASGTLMRVGEGFMQQWIAIVFFVVGSVWAARDFGWWSVNVIMPTSISDGVTKGFHLPTAFGWGFAFFGQLIILAAIFLFADWYEKKKLNKVPLEN